MIYTVIALRCLGVPDDDPGDAAGRCKQLDDLMIEEDDTLRLQPCFSPVWDTALSLNALADAGVAGHEQPTSSSGRPLAARPRSAPARATGAWPTRSWSRAAGSSSIATASTPTPTTPPWC